MSEQELSREQIDRRQELEKKIFQLLSNRPGLRLQELVEILDAEEFLVHVKGGLQFKFKEYSNLLLEKEEKTGVKNILPTDVIEVDKVIIPSRGGEILAGSGEGLEEKKIIPRTRYLMEVLSELGLEYKVETGKLDENMFRSRGYQIFVIPEKKKLIFVNNEEGHATRIVHGFRDFDQNDKFGVIEKDIIDYLSDLNVDELDLDESIIVKKINYPGNEEEYKQKMKEAVLFVLTKKNTEMFDPKEKKERKVWKYEELKEVVKKIGITTSHQYANKYSLYGWPFYQTIQKMPEWEGWDEFLGREIMTYDKLKDAVQDVGITSPLDYRNNVKEKGWPTPQTLKKMPEWKSWNEFLGIKEITYQDLKKSVHQAGIKSYDEYREVARLNSKWPSSAVTLRKMPEWEGWDKFLGREIMTYDKLKDAVKDVGITSSLDYRNNAPKNGWPSNQTLTTMPEWEGWDKFLDREPKKEWTYEELKLAIRKVGVKSSKKYQNMTPSKGWPAVDTLRNLPEWEGWDEFLGRKK